MPAISYAEWKAPHPGGSIHLSVRNQQSTNLGVIRERYSQEMQKPRPSRNTKTAAYSEGHRERLTEGKGQILCSSRNPSGMEEIEGPLS